MVSSVMTDILADILPAERITEARKWMRSLKNRDVSGMLSDEEDRALTIKQIIVRPDKTLQFRFIDGSTMEKIGIY